MTGGSAASPDRADNPEFFQIQTRTGWARTLGAFAAWCQPPPGCLALDVGSGPGLLPALLEENGCRAYGVDIDPAAFFPDRLHARVVVGDALRLPFAGRSFDLVTSSNLLFLMPEPEQVLAEMARVLKPGGEVMVLNPSEHLSVASATELVNRRGLQGLARDTFLNWAARAEAHYRWTEPELAELFSRVGLSLVASELKVGFGLARFARGKLADHNNMRLE